ncbi:chymotrypsin inhibitor-like [Zeugodacus cucurbitae]|uniref:chymotrypsin inhibitor-like n=1 Tax=Zeugodacus cucurbitae TaxID=28588 RepID=UPI0023D9552E|nr:chymotrypsin inhibitor-like [Zeugodacus cucurbitae]
MNTKSCLLFLLGVCIVGFVSAKPQNDSGSCGENQVFTTCGSACAPTCALRDVPIFCAGICIVGCQCIPGYLWNNLGSCVLPEDC